MIDEQKLLDQLVASARHSFDLIKQRSANAEIIAYGILSDDSASSFTPIAATSDGLASFSPDSQDDFRFNPENWDLGGDYDDLSSNYGFLDSFEATCEDYENDDHWHEEYRSRVYQLAVRTLERLKSDHYFSDDTYLMVWVTDSTVPLYRATAWSKRLNNSDTHRLFVEWLDSFAGRHETP